jgi:NADPH-dependent F420 reductase
MNIGIIGAGGMARGIGSRFVAGGNEVVISARDDAKAAALAADLNGAANGKARAGSRQEALAADVVVLALPYDAARAFAAENAAALAGKVVVDITNPLNATYDGLATAPGTSAAEEIAAVLPESFVVKAFNTTFAGPLVSGAVAGNQLDVLVAGNDETARRTVSALVEGAGLRAIDAGGLERARQLEGLALLGITLQSTLGTGFQSAWKLVA